jgi:hypothetical protein
MKSLAIGIGQTVLATSILLISHCMDVTHAGSTDAERCENNMITFAKSFECEAHKQAHDQEFGHDSTCSAGMGGLPMIPAVAATDTESVTPDTISGTSQLR